LIISIKGTAEDGLENATHEKDTVQSFSRALSRSLSFLRLKVADGQEDFLGAYYLHFLEVGAQMIPNHLKYNPDPRTTDFNFDMKQTPLPKAISRLIDSVTQSWKEENTRFIFDVTDDLKIQFEIIDQISAQWDSFWMGLNEPTQNQIRQDALSRIDQIPTVLIDPNSPPDLRVLSKWYVTSIQGLEAVSQELGNADPENPHAVMIPNLLQKSEDWINTNLWPIIPTP
jgi:hypothetical protein